MIDIKDKRDCCGCNACGDICPKEAVSFETDIEGFWYPVVDRAKCVDCGLCEKVCPVLHADACRVSNEELPVCYVAENKNVSIVFASTSGGAFSVFADAAYREKGYVGGAVFNDDFSVRHILSAKREDIARIRGSKYIQSSFSGFYTAVKKALNEGDFVVVCGGPCQMAALRTFLGKDYDNLILIDYICRGIGSPKAFQNYLRSFEKRYGSPVVHARAKAKDLGWRNLTQQVDLADGRRIFETSAESAWTSHFNRDGLFHRPSCHACRFRGFPRVSDITIADFWGVEKIKLENIKDKNLGLSLIMVNSKKGSSFFETVKKKFNFQQVPFEMAVRGNAHLYRNVQQEPVDREEFYRALDRMSLQEALSVFYQNYNRIPLLRRMRRTVKNILRFGYAFIRYTRLHPRPVLQFFRWNRIPEILRGNMLLPTPHCVIQNHGTIKVRGVVVLGGKRVLKSKAETRLLIDKGGVFETAGSCTIGYGSDIQVFHSGHLVFEGGNIINSDAVIICAEDIRIGKNTAVGRGVVIRDNHGEHWMNIPGYRPSRPVQIGEHVWFGERAVVMPGVKIGSGSVISACSVVTGNLPARCLCAGHPAQVVQTEIAFKL